MSGVVAFHRAGVIETLVIGQDEHPRRSAMMASGVGLRAPSASRLSSQRRSKSIHPETGSQNERIVTRRSPYSSRNILDRGGEGSRRDPVTGCRELTVRMPVERGG